MPTWASLGLFALVFRSAGFLTVLRVYLDWRALNGFPAAKLVSLRYFLSRKGKPSWSLVAAPTRPRTLMESENSPAFPCISGTSTVENVLVVLRSIPSNA